MPNRYSWFHEQGVFHGAGMYIFTLQASIASTSFGLLLIRAKSVMATNGCLPKSVDPLRIKSGEKTPRFFNFITGLSTNRINYQQLYIFDNVYYIIINFKFT